MNIEITQLKYYNIWNSQIYRLGSMMFGSQPLRFAITLIIILLPNVLYIFLVNFENQFIFLLVVELIVVVLFQFCIVNTDPGIITKNLIMKSNMSYFKYPNSNQFLQLVDLLPNYLFQVLSLFNLNIVHLATFIDRQELLIVMNVITAFLILIIIVLGQDNVYQIRFYYGFLTLLIFCIFKLSNSNFQNYQEYIAILIIIYSLPLNLFLIYLFILHTYLIYTCQSTKEYIKREWSTNVGNPFKQQFWKKIKSIFLSKQPTFINYDISYYRLQSNQTLDISNDKSNTSVNQLQIFPIKSEEQNEVVEMIVVK